MLRYPYKQLKYLLVGVYMDCWGRTYELKQLEKIQEKSQSSLVVIMGRRRIGKSYLAKYFGKSYTHALFFEGLAPQPKQTNQTQLDIFAKELTLQTGTPGFKFTDWSDAFTALAKLIKNKKIFILLDEISWMGHHDPDFSGKLKIAWDNHFSNNKNLILIVCGSVSAWIDKNILNSSDFVGRVSLQINLGELPLASVKNFIGKKRTPTK
ncbi:MAG: ATP-binding protein, partial [Bdellovibrionales bacterium]